MKKNFVFLFVLLLSLILFAGCEGDESSTDNISYESGEGNLEVVVNWNEFNSISTESLGLVTAQNNSEITHTGARVVYEEYNAVFAQSLEKKVSEEEGIITFKLPASKNADLFLVAVTYDPEIINGNIVRLYGYIEDLKIQANSFKKITMEDINWIPAEWKVDENYRSFLEENIIADKNEDVFKLPVYVRDPFQVNQNIYEDIFYDELYIGINGTASTGKNPDGWRLFDINNDNSEVGTIHQENYNFQPYLKASFFNLPLASSRYYIPPIIDDFTINWE